MLSQRSFNRGLFLKARDRKTPVIGTFELTSRCNLSCRMCYVHAEDDREAKSAELSAKEWLEVGKQTAKEGMLYLLLTGGEPLLRPDFLEIYENLYKLGLQLSLNTNATLITPEIADMLAVLPPLNVGVTLYGASPDIYERVCGNGDSFECTLRGIRLLKERGISVSLRTTIIRQNKEDVEKIHAISRELGLRLKLVDYVFAGRECAGSDPFSVRLSPAEQDACLEQVVALSDLNEIQQKEDVDAESREERTQGGGAFTCAAGSFSFAVNCRGKLQACLMIDEPYVELKNPGEFKQQWENLVQLCAAVPVCEECINCDSRKYCTVCPAKCKGETGFIHGKPEYICEMAKLAASRAGLKEGIQAAP